MRSTLLTLALCALLMPSLHAQTGKKLDRIVAVVGNEIITESELELQLLRISVRSHIDPKDPVVRSRVLDDLLNRKLMLTQAVLDSVQVSEDMVTQQLNDQIRQFEAQYGSTQKLEQAAGMSVSQMKREFREDIRKNLMIESLQREKFGQVTVSTRETEEFFRAYRDSLPQVPEQVLLRQISMYPKIMESFKESARKKAEAILDSIKAGKDFAELAKMNSDDAGSARNGGDLGQARRGVFVKEFEEAAFALQPGQVSGVIESPFGFHIIKVLERKGEAIRCAHILIRVQKTGESDDIVKQKLTALRTRILGGEDFETIARQFSEDPDTKQYGGDMGLLEVQQLGTDLQLIQQKLSSGEICEPTKITLDRDYAFAIVQLVKRVPPHAPVLADDYQRITGYARVYKQNRLYTEWLETIKKSVYWKVNL